MKTLRSLRLWHWKQVLMYRKAARRYADAANRYDTASLEMKAKSARRVVVLFNTKADNHLSAVQALNDVVSGTAEQDAQESQ